MSPRNRSAGTLAPGVSVTCSSATQRQVVASETFLRPPVVGFQSIDSEVHPDGRLSETGVPPVEHFHRREEKKQCLVPRV